jgi:short-subunit dehydrogenase
MSAAESPREQAIVIGAGPGLGRALALTFARQGFDVGLVARREAELERIAGEVRALGRRAAIAGADAADPDTVAAAVERLCAAAPLAILSYNAGVDRGALLANDFAALAQATNVNALAAVRAVQSALPALRASGGTVLLTGGGSALWPSGSEGVLSLGKAALRGAAFALAEELAPLGVTVRTVTIAGRIVPGTAFDPERIAQTFWDVYSNPSTEVERMYTGE